VIYAKLHELQRFAGCIREPYRSRFIDLIESVYPNISAIIYTNSLDDEEMLIYAMLLKLADNPTSENKEKLFKCLSILLT